MNFCSLGPFHGVQSFRKGLLQCVSSTGLQVLPENLLQCGLLISGHSSCRESAPVWALHGFQLCSRHVHLLWCGSFMGCRVDIFSTVDLSGLRGNKLCCHGLQGNLCSNSWSTSSSSSIDLSVSKAISFPFFSLLSQLLHNWCGFFLPLLKYVTIEALPASLMGSALASSGSILELAGTGFV